MQEVPLANASRSNEKKNIYIYSYHFHSSLAEALVSVLAMPSREVLSSDTPHAMFRHVLEIPLK